MSGIELLGILASATQLADYSIRIASAISEIYKRVKNAPERIRQYSVQIDELSRTASLIGKHPQLQTDSVHAHLKSTLREAEHLFRVLERVQEVYTRKSVQRYWKSLQGWKEKEIIATFDRLEQEKTALALSIAVIHTNLLCSIEGGVHDLIQETILEFKGSKVRSVRLLVLTIYSLRLYSINRLR